METAIGRGDRVIVRCWRNEAALMVVWEADQDRVSVVAPTEFKAMMEGRSELFPLSFPRHEVFQIGDAQESRVRFDALRPY